jgi:hypothetical protein
VDVAFWLWLAASILLVAFGMLLAMAQPGIPGLWRGVGVLYALAGLGLVLLAAFALMSRGVIWLLIMVLTMVGAVLVMRPTAAAWFDTTGEM